mgnify:CR=1 FL=1
MKINHRKLILWLVDILIANASFGISFYYTVRTSHFTITPWATVTVVLAITAFTLLVYMLLNINKTIWRYSTERDYFKIFVAACFSSGAACTLFLLSGIISLPWQNYVFAVLLNASLAVFSRVVYRLWMNTVHTKSYENNSESADKKRLLIIGAGEAGSKIIGEIKSNPLCGYEAIVLLDDDTEKIGRSIKGVTVVGQISEVDDVCVKYKIQEILVAIPSASNKKRSEILDYCAKAGVPLKILPHFSESDFFSAVRSSASFCSFSILCFSFSAVSSSFPDMSAIILRHFPAIS